MANAEDTEKKKVLEKCLLRRGLIRWLPPSRMLALMILMILVTQVQHLFLPQESIALEVLLETCILLAFILPLYSLIYRPAWLELQRSEEEIRRLSRQQIRSEEKIRKVLACDLHDEFGQVLTALQFGVESVCSSLPADQQDLVKQCGRLSGMIADLGSHVRDVTAKLRPTMIDNVGLMAALRWHAVKFETQHPGVTVHICAEEDVGRLPPEAAISLYRVCQESLNNVAKHAKAREVRIELQRSPKLLALSIRDDGIGFDSERRRDSAGSPGGFGILGMRERIADLGGRLEVVSRPGKGTEVRVLLPQAERKEDR